MLLILTEAHDFGIHLFLVTTTFDITTTLIITTFSKPSSPPGSTNFSYPLTLKLEEVVKSRASRPGSEGKFSENLSRRSSRPTESFLADPLSLMFICVSREAT